MAAAAAAAVAAAGEAAAAASGGVSANEEREASQLVLVRHISSYNIYIYIYACGRTCCLTVLFGFLGSGCFVIAKVFLEKRRVRMTIYNFSNKSDFYFLKFTFPQTLSLSLSYFIYLFEVLWCVYVFYLFT